MRIIGFIIVAVLAFVAAQRITIPPVNPALLFAVLWTGAIVAGWRALTAR